MPDLKSILDDCVSVPEYAKGRNKSRAWGYQQVDAGLPVLEWNGRLLIHIPSANDHLRKQIKQRRAKRQR